MELHSDGVGLPPVAIVRAVTILLGVGDWR